MQYAKKAGHHVGTKDTMEIGGEMGDYVFESLPHSFLLMDTQKIRI